MIGIVAIALFLSATACAQADDRDDDQTKLPLPAETYYRLALWDRAEKEVRDLLAKEPSDRLQGALINTLYRARKYDECMRECERLAGSKDAAARAAALAL